MKRVVTFESILMAVVTKYGVDGAIVLSDAELDAAAERGTEAVYAQLLGPDGRSTALGNEATICRLDIITKREAGRRWWKAHAAATERQRTHPDEVIVRASEVPERPTRGGDN